MVPAHLVYHSLLQDYTLWIYTSRVICSTKYHKVAGLCQIRRYLVPSPA